MPRRAMHHATDLLRWVTGRRVATAHAAAAGALALDDAAATARQAHCSALLRIVELSDRIAVTHGSLSPHSMLAFELAQKVDIACQTGVQALGWSDVQARTFRRTFALQTLLAARRPPETLATGAERIGPAPPPTRREPVVRFSDDGLACDIDPYAWLEGSGPEIEAHVETQTGYTAGLLTGFPGYADLQTAFADIRARTPPQITAPRPQGNAVLYHRQGPADNVPVLCLRDDAGERVLFDPGCLGDDQALAWYRPSPSGRTIALCVGCGNENHEIRFIDRDGTLLPDRLPNAWHGQPDWLDEHTLVYRTHPPLTADKPTVQWRMDTCLAVHVMGQPASADVPVFGCGMRPDVAIGPAEATTAWTTGDYVIAKGAMAGPRPELRLHAARREDLAAAACAGSGAQGVHTWKPVADVSDGVRAFAVHGDDIYLVTYRSPAGGKAPRYCVVRSSLAAAEPQPPELVQGELDDAVIVNAWATRDALYVHASRPDGDRLLRTPFGPGEAETVPLPFAGFLSDVHADPQTEELLFTLQSPVEPPRIYRIADSGSQPVDTTLQQPYPQDLAEGLVWETHWAPNKGVSIPTSVVRGLRTDGPTRLHAYASYGSHPAYHIGTAFDPRALHLVRHYGMVQAHAHPRGGGMLGHDWYMAGLGPNKPVGWSDLHAVPISLEQAGIGRSAQVVVEVRSAGGRLAPAVIPHPERFAGLVLDVAILDGILAATQDPIAPFNTHEAGGTTETGAGFQAMQAIHGYSQLRPGPLTRTLGVTGLHDGRVLPGHTLKYVARAQAVNSGNQRVMLYTTDGGHQIQRHDQRDARAVDVAAFVLWAGGHLDFQMAGSPMPG
jgi:prolyl oligopeptidase